jgi:hypothetical protein
LQPILYLETNFALAVARGQDPDATELLHSLHPWVDFAFPTVCFMEALSVLNHEEKQSRAFGESLSRRGQEHARDKVHPENRRFGDDLIAASISNINLFDLFRCRLHDCLTILSGVSPGGHGPVLLIEATGLDVVDALARDVPEDRTDGLILSCIVRHVRDHLGVPKAFLSQNKNDFQDPEILGRLAEVGITYFSATKSAIGWIQARIKADGKGGSADTGSPIEPTE